MTALETERNDWRRTITWSFTAYDAGTSNDSIHKALVDLMGKPIAESSALCIPTAAHACPGGASMAYRIISGLAASPLCELGWKSLGVLEFTALPSIKEEHWVPVVQEADALLVRAAISCICATECASPDWQTSCRRCGARRSK